MKAEVWRSDTPKGRWSKTKFPTDEEIRAPSVGKQSLNKLEVGEVSTKTVRNEITQA